jgi:hypothetical protein
MSTPTCEAICFVEATIPRGARTGSREAGTVLADAKLHGKNAAGASRSAQSKSVIKKSRFACLNMSFLI